MNLSPFDFDGWGHALKIPDSIRRQLPSDAILFPGLVNAHDHLEFNLFPLLANRTYSDYLEWGDDIHQKNGEIIRQVQQIPLEQRLLFGVLKNLVNGITRVVHHGGHKAMIPKLTRYPVWMDYQYLHSLGTEKWWKLKLNIPFGKFVMIHVGEGISDRASAELKELPKWNLLKRRLIAIHAISMTEAQASDYHAVVWCPASNLTLYGKTLDPARISRRTSVFFGTDSGVSASVNFWDQLRLAQSLKMIRDEELLEMLTTRPYGYFFPQEDMKQDWVMAIGVKGKNQETFFQLNPENILMVVIRGQTWLCDDSLPQTLRPTQALPVRLGKAIKWVPAHLGSVVHTLESKGTTLPLEISSCR